MRIFHRLRTKLMLMMTFVTLVPVVTTSIYTIYVYSNTLRTQSFQKPLQEAKSLKNTIESFLATTKSDVLFLSQSAPLINYLSLRSAVQSSKSQKQDADALPAGSDDAALQAAQNALEQKQEVLEQELLAFIRNRGIYYQITYVDETGQEIIRVVSDGLRNKSIEPDKLQNQSDSDYFKETMRLAGKQVYVSPLELHRTDADKIEMPHRPVMRYAVNVYYENDHKAGIVVCTIDANQFLKLLGETRLVDEDGYFLNHPDSQHRWGGPADLNTKSNLETDYSPETAKQLIGQVATLNLDTLTLFSDVIYVPGTSQHWTLIIQRDTAEVLNNELVFRMMFGSLLGTTLLIILLLAWWFSLRISRPFEQLSQIADAVSKGEQLDKRIDIKDQGEIGVLIQAFERMRVSVVRSLDRLRNPPK